MPIYVQYSTWTMLVYSTLSTVLLYKVKNSSLGIYLEILLEDVPDFRVIIFNKIYNLMFPFQSHLMSYHILFFIVSNICIGNQRRISYVLVHVHVINLAKLFNFKVISLLYEFELYLYVFV